jgi:V8-like Glu-specific endopeptidase
MPRPVSACAALVLAAACSHPSQVSFVSNERPTTQGAPAGVQPPSAAHAENPNGPHELPSDDEIIEPDHPAAESRQERALVHIHGPNNVVCSGVMLGPAIVATAQQCLKTEGKGVTAFAPSREYRVEVPSSTLTWTNRRAKYAVIPSCDWSEVDLAFLVLAEPAPWVQPLKVISAPNTGAKVQALGFGHCAGQPKTLAMKDRIGTVRSRVAEAIVIDLPLCKGDAGGPVVDGRDGDVIGVISRRDDPEGSPLRTTTIARLDTAHARELLEQAKMLAAGGDSSKVTAVACR